MSNVYYKTPSLILFIILLLSGVFSYISLGSLFIYEIVLVGWFYSVAYLGNNSQRFVGVSLAFNVFICALIFYCFLKCFGQRNIIVGLSKFSMLLSGSFVCVKAAMTLTSLNENKSAKLNDARFDLLRLFVWPIGLWSVQREVKCLAKQKLNKNVK
jgi:hypothetical protein